ncbi:MAG: ATP-binding protein [Candidatus Syntrophosphaera sp.]
MKIAIASGKGGTGKTTLAVNLALRAAENREVSLVDLDVEEPNSGIFIHGKLENEQRIFRSVPKWDREACTLCGKCVELCQYNAIIRLGKEIMVMPQLCHSCYACSELCPTDALPMRESPLGTLRHKRIGRLDFIESKLDIGMEMASPMIGKTLEYMSEHCSGNDYQFRDCPPGTACPVISATKDADFIILVTEPTPFGLYDLELAAETMRHLGKPMSVVVNRYGIGNDEVFHYCKEQDIPVWAKIPNQREMAELYSRGELIYPKVEEFRRELDAILGKLDSLGRNR